MRLGTIFCFLARLFGCHCRITFLTLALMCLPLFFVSSYAQPIKITLGEAISIALKNNPSVIRAYLDIKDSKITNQLAVGAFIPSLNINSSANTRIARQFNNSTGEFQDSLVAINVLSGSVRLDYTLFNGFRRINELRRARSLKRSSEENLRYYQENMVFNLLTRYLAVLSSHELLGIAQKQLETSIAQLNQIQEQVDVGVKPIVDLYNQEVVVANNELQVTNNRNELKLNKMDLVRTIGLDPLLEYEFISEGLEENLNYVVQDMSFEKLVEIALDKRSDYKSEQFILNARKYELDGNRGSLWPTINFNASVSTSYNDSYRDVERVSFSDQILNRNLDYTYGINIRIPILDGFVNRSAINRSKLNYQRQKLSLEDKKREIIYEVTQSHNTYLSTLDEMKSNQKALEAANKILMVQQDRYELGNATYIELRQATSDHFEAQSNLLRSQYSHQFQIKLLQYYIGTLTIHLEQVQ